MRDPLPMRFDERRFRQPVVMARSSRRRIRLPWPDRHDPRAELMAGT